MAIKFAEAALDANLKKSSKYADSLVIALSPMFVGGQLSRKCCRNRPISSSVVLSPTRGTTADCSEFHLPSRDLHGGNARVCLSTSGYCRAFVTIFRPGGSWTKPRWHCRRDRSMSDAQLPAKLRRLVIVDEFNAIRGRQRATANSSDAGSSRLRAVHLTSDGCPAPPPPQPRSGNAEDIEEPAAFPLSAEAPRLFCG